MGSLGDADRQLRLPQVQNLDATETAAGHSQLWENLATWEKVAEPKLKK